jgi:N-carbamoyl-L-amino-acid hydrolase
MHAVCRQEKKCYIQAGRLMERLRELGEIGRNASGGIDRQLASPADVEARSWLRECWSRELGLSVVTDEAANLWGKEPAAGTAAPIVLGSHHDTVPSGGAYDGALGVLMATEVMQSLQESGIALRHPLELVSFTGEEPNSFAVSTLGSKLLCGRLQAADIAQLADKDSGESLPAALRRLGGNPAQVARARLHPGDKAAFIECHIEQGRRLYDRQEAVASVSCITGIYREIITVRGEANHAGTTRPEYRRDALAAAADICLAVEQLMQEPGLTEGLAATVGQVEVQPNASNIVPGQAVLSLDLRTAVPEQKQLALSKLEQAVQEIAARRQVEVERDLVIDQPEMAMDTMVVQALEDAMAEAGCPVRRFVSMAGHDAANMARVTRAAMLFTSCVEGYSHCAREKASAADIAVAAQVMLDAVVLLDRRL